MPPPKQAEVESTAGAGSQQNTLGGSTRSADFLKMELFDFATAVHMKMTFLPARAVAVRKEMDQIGTGGLTGEK